MQKYFILFIITLSLFSCDKNKDFPQYTSLYHIDGNDTISVVYIPNSFTQNNNLVNDVFKIIGMNIYERDFELKIYRRDGELVYRSEYLGSVWDGTYKGVSAENGNYHFALNTKDSTGYVYYYEGVIELVR